MKIITGDLVKLASDGEFDVIIHGCNCFHTMGGGIAKQIKRSFPEAYDEDLLTPRAEPGEMGTISYACIKRELRLDIVSGETTQHRIQVIVVNGYTQFQPGPPLDASIFDSEQRRLLALERVFRQAAFVAYQFFRKPRIGYPKIGAGLAGGDWNKIAPIIDQELDGMNHALVVLPEVRK